MVAPRIPHPPRTLSLIVLTILLFVVWSNSFVAIGYLLGSEKTEAGFDWIGLTVARFLPAGLLCAAYCLGFRFRETREILRRRWRRLLLCGLLGVPLYNLSLYYGQAHGVPAPIASLTTTLAPLFLVILGILCFGERLSRRRAAGFVVALAGVVLISRARSAGDGSGYAVLILITAIAPLSWAVFSVLSKPVSRECSPVLWTYLSIMAGTAPLLLVAPFRGGPEMASLDGFGWGMLLYLSIGCTILGFSLWVYLLKHLPASTLGLTVFLNPPLTTVSKLLLATLLPSLFRFQIAPLEMIGGVVVLLGLALALLRLRGMRGNSG